MLPDLNSTKKFIMEISDLFYGFKIEYDLEYFIKITVYNKYLTFDIDFMDYEDENTVLIWVNYNYLGLDISDDSFDSFISFLNNTSNDFKRMAECLQGAMEMLKKFVPDAYLDIGMDYDSY